MPSNQLSVQYCINRLKVQTEKLRVKILGNGDAHELHFQENTGRRMGRTMTTARK